MLFVEASRQAKVGEFDMSIFIDENVVRLDITAQMGISKTS